MIDDNPQPPHDNDNADPAAIPLTDHPRFQSQLRRQIEQSCALLDIPETLFMAVFGEWVRVMLHLAEVPTSLESDVYADLMTQFCEGQDAVPQMLTPAQHAGRV